MPARMLYFLYGDEFHFGMAILIKIYDLHELPLLRLNRFLVFFWQVAY